MLMFTDVNLKLILHIEKYENIESMKEVGGGGLQGIVSMICQGYIEADNEMLKFYDHFKPKIWIICEDANNLYGHSKIGSFSFEISDFVHPEKFSLGNYREDGPVGRHLRIILLNCIICTMIIL